MILLPSNKPSLYFIFITQIIYSNCSLKSQMKLLPFLFFFLIIEPVLSGCGNKNKKSSAELQQSGPSKQPPLIVETIILHPTLLNDVIEVPGSLLAYETTEIHPEVSGRVVQMNLKEGTFTKKGDLLVKLYDGDLQ